MAVISSEYFNFASPKCIELLDPMRDILIGSLLKSVKVATRTHAGEMVHTQNFAFTAQNSQEEFGKLQRCYQTAMRAVVKSGAIALSHVEVTIVFAHLENLLDETTVILDPTGLTYDLAEMEF